MYVFVNPYAILDQKGRLAGVSPKGEPIYGAGQKPKREFIGAAIDREHAAKTYTPGDDGQGISPKSDVRFVFETTALFIEERRDLAMFYKHAFEAKDRGQPHGIIIKVADEKAVPLDELVAARAAAIAMRVADFGEAPDESGWSAQFPLDEQVKARAAELEKKAQDEAAAAKAKAEADIAEAAKKAAAEKAAADKAAKQAAQAAAKES